MPSRAILIAPGLVLRCRVADLAVEAAVGVSELVSLVMYCSLQLKLYHRFILDMAENFSF